MNLMDFMDSMKPMDLYLLQSLIQSTVNWTLRAVDWIEGCSRGKSEVRV